MEARVPERRGYFRAVFRLLCAGRFRTRNPGRGLARAGFKFAEPVFVAWLGVVPYLSREAIEETLRFVGNEIRASSEIVFDYPLPLSDERAGPSREAQNLASRVALIGEPFRTAFLPEEINAILAALGFDVVEDMDTQGLNARYFRGRSDAFALRGSAHLMRARHGAVSTQ
jgi:O-methyltransferase involved in polyketide biosynthesis